MCLLLLDWQTHAQYHLVVAANRDEFHARPSAAAAWWADHASIYGGRDLEAQGTWMAINRHGHFAAVTNVRKTATGGNKTRGALAVDFLNQENPDINAYLRRLKTTANEFDGYNFVGFDGRELGWFNNVDQHVRILPIGIYGLSNASLDTAWPKVTRLKTSYNQILATSANIDEPLFELLQDKKIASDESLPSTGIGLTLERQLSPIFIEGPDYGTRCSTLYTLDRRGRARYVERRFDNRRNLIGETSQEFEINLGAK